MPSLTQKYTVGAKSKNPAIRFRDENGVDIDITGKTIRFRMVDSNSPNGVKVNNAAATIVNATTGQARYDWATVDIDTAGIYWAWWIIDDAGSLEYFPADYDLVIEIWPITGVGFPPTP